MRCLDDRMRIVPPMKFVDGVPVVRSPRTKLNRGPMPNPCAEAREAKPGTETSAARSTTARRLMDTPGIMRTGRIFGLNGRGLYISAIGRLWFQLDAIGLLRWWAMPPATSVRVSARVSGFSYAIRNIVVEAKKLEAAGRTVRYMNIGDPVQAGFKTPPHLVEAVERAMRDGHNGYAPSAGIPEAREAVAAEYTRRGVPTSADRVVLSSGTSEGIELALSALVDVGDEVLVPTPTYPLYTAVLAKLGAHAALLPHGSRRRLDAGVWTTCAGSSRR